MRAPTIRRTLIRIGMTVSAVALSLACGTILAYDAAAFHSSARQELSGLAEIVARQCTAAVAFNDPQAAEEILSGLRSKGDVVEARLDLADGAPFARWAREGPSVVRAEAEHTLAEDGMPLARVRISSDLRHEQGRLGRVALVSAAALAGALLVSFLLMSRLERHVTRPVTRLAEVVKTVTEGRDYGVRAEKVSDDEIGLLIGGFNEMLAQIQARDAALQAARDRLEERVEERTLDLQRANAALEAEIGQRRRGESALRESEDRYRRLFESSPDALLVMSDGDVCLANPAALRLLGANSPSDLLGTAFLDRIQGERREVMQNRLFEVRRGGEAGPFEDSWIRLDGASFDGESVLIPFVDRGDPVFQIVLRDITRRKEADRLKNEFVSTVSHELRTPLTALRGALALLGSGKLGALPAPAKPFLDIANADCQRLIRLINDLLDIQKIEAGRMEYQMKPLELMPLVRRAIETARPYGEQNGVRLGIAAGVEDALVSGDDDRLLQVLGNLLSNAVKFSPRGSGVDVSVRRREKSVRVSVQDRGPGIPESFRDRIFQRFAQADSSDTRQKGGTGLGLSICRSIVEQHAGVIGFETEVDSGTTFFVDLPELPKRPLSDKFGGPSSTPHEPSVRY